MAERSGLDMLSELLKEIKLIRQEMKVLDQNIKRIANSAKISELATKALGTPLKDWAKPKNPTIEAVSSRTINKENLRFKFETVDASKIKQEQPSRSARKEPTLCICKGKMVAEHKGKSAPLSGLSVKIYNDKDKLIKETKTNRAGHWMSQLPKGNYVANIEGKFNGQELYPVNLVFVVKSGMKSLEVK
jgi:hypothetical protein